MKRRLVARLLRALLRRLRPWSARTTKRLVKSPKIFLRDSGLLHAPLGISSYEELLRHPLAGASWEGFVIEQLLGSLAAQGLAAEPSRLMKPTSSGVILPGGRPSRY